MYQDEHDTRDVQLWLSAARDAHQGACSGASQTPWQMHLTETANGTGPGDKETRDGKHCFMQKYFA